MLSEFYYLCNIVISVRFLYTLAELFTLFTGSFVQNCLESKLKNNGSTRNRELVPLLLGCISYLHAVRGFYATLCEYCTEGQFVYLLKSCFKCKQEYPML